jgi:GT2 family glycosyltransferase
VSAIGVVAIGRNEGERLRRCLESLDGHGLTVVYVDSGSTDDSVALARSLGIDVVDLDMSIPFTAARARNAGFERLLQIDPGVRFVQFLDGDCEVADGWLERARGELEDQPRVAIIFGLRRERFPERSSYNRMADIEWNMPMAWGTPDGTAQACGGDAMIRAEALRSVGGYNPSVPAGEEPELCRRLQRAGWMVVRVDASMTWHDAAMLRFCQWARRQFRTGYGGLDFTTRFGRGGDNPFRSQIRSARIWGLGWPLALLVGAAGAGMLGGPIACSSAAGLIALAPCVQAARIAARNWSRAGGSRGALTYGMLTVVGKGFQMAGQLLYTRDRLVGRHARLIEYKFTTPGARQTASIP